MPGRVAIAEKLLYKRAIREISTCNACDLDGNGVELYRDRPHEEWPRPPDGAGVAMVTAPLDVRALLAEAP